MTLRHAGRGVALAAALVITVAACGQTLDQAQGIVLSVESPSLGRVDSFELLTPDGGTLRFDTADLEFREAFPVAHLAEHMRVSEPIVVTFRRDGDELVATRIDDAEGDRHG